MFRRLTNRRGISKPPRRYRQKTKTIVNNKLEISPKSDSDSYSKPRRKAKNEATRYNPRRLLPTEEIFAFIEKKRRLFFYYMLFLFGVILGTLIFNVSKDLLTQDLKLILDTGPITGGIAGGLSELVSSCFSTVILLLILFVCGLSACGVPVAIVAPIFLGLGIGLSSAFHYNSGLGGIAINAVLIIPHTLISSAAVVLGSMESAKMSINLSRHLISKKSNSPGLHREFKIYCLRFLLYIALGIVAGIVDIMFKIIFSKLIIV